LLTPEIRRSATTTAAHSVREPALAFARAIGPLVHRTLPWLGSGALTAPAGKQVTVRFKLSRKHRKILAKRKKIRMTATIVARDKAGNMSRSRARSAVGAWRQGTVSLAPHCG